MLTYSCDELRTLNHTHDPPTVEKCSQCVVSHICGSRRGIDADGPAGCPRASSCYTCKQNNVAIS